MRWRMWATIRDHCKPISGIRISSTRALYGAGTGSVQGLLAIAGQVPAYVSPHYSDPDYGGERAQGEPRGRRGFFTPTKELPFST